MDRPLVAKTVAEFWGRRWNRAFRDVGYRAIFRPLVASSGPTIATIGVFSFSGMLHELAISVPAGGGFGLPTMYFALQASAVLLENSSIGKRMLNHSWRGRLFSAVVVAAPAPLLFHPRFVANVIAPFLRAIWPA
jgi:alginate O-acetyltransferase complex protein AlgI